MMKHIKTWWRQHKNLIQARRWLKYGDAPLIVARAMFALNRFARSPYTGPGSKEIIYRLKNELIRWLYENGHCISATLQVQTFDCWHTWEYNNGWDDYCEKCDNTGIYRRVLLYRFVLRVSGRYFVWHQPESLVNWDIELTSPEQGEYHGSRQRRSMPLDLLELYAAVVYVFLRLQGVPVDRLPKAWSLKEALRREWYQITLAVRVRYNTIRRRWARRIELYKSRFELLRWAWQGASLDNDAPEAIKDVIEAIEEGARRKALRQSVNACNELLYKSGNGAVDGVNECINAIECMLEDEIPF